MNTLKSTISFLLDPAKGILAADESAKTLQKRFDKIGIASNPKTNLAYRKMLFTTPGIEEFLSGVILYDETIRQEVDGISVPKYLESKGILAGIKVDQGVVDMVTTGLDGLRERLTEYKNLGAKFAKWRAVIIVGQEDALIEENAEVLAKYALISQRMGLVPIIEPEVVRNGAHDLIRCKEVTAKMLKAVFEKISVHNVDLEGLILKTNMVTSGESSLTQASPEEVAKTTVEVLLQSVPKEVPGIVFLSGGQSPDMATDNLEAICKIGGPWLLSFSFARALQDEALTMWTGKEENVSQAQQAFLERLKKVSTARSAKPS